MPELTGSLSTVISPNIRSSLRRPTEEILLSVSFKTARLLPYQHISNLRTFCEEEYGRQKRRKTEMALQAQNDDNTRCSPCPLNCTAVESCTACSPDCKNSPCSAIPITPQCTDRCVVVACNDPEHSDPVCPVSAVDLLCNAECVGTTECDEECNGFTEFLQCCADYHAYIADPRQVNEISANSGNDTMWHSSFPTMLCQCQQLNCTQAGVGEGHQILRSSRVASHTPSAADESDSGFPSEYNSPSMFHPGPVSTPVALPFQPPSSGQNAPQSIATDRLQCMWANCDRTFYSLPEFVGHVNLEHLRPPNLPHVQSHTTQATIDYSSLSCLWDNCNIQPAPDSIAGSSTGNQVEAALGVLATHLFHDHLGLPNDRAFVPCSTIPGPSDSAYDALSPAMNPRASASLSSQPGSLSPPSPSAHSASCNPECDTMHTCQWKGCHASFSSCDELTNHITNGHIGGGKAHYDCLWGICNRNGENGFSSKQKICRHLQTHTGHRPFQCDECKQNFSEAATLQQHMRRHTQERPYVCDYPGCGKSFAITGALTIHKRSHNGVKPFKCTHCDKAFAESSNLSKHLRTHTGERPYSCSIPGCSKCFARPDQLTRHMSVHVGKEKATGPDSVMKSPE